MTTKTSKKVLEYAFISAMVVTGLAVATFAITASTIQAQAVVQPPADEDGQIHSNPMSAESYVKATGNSAVKAEFPTKMVQLKKGTSTTVNVVIKHIGGANAKPTSDVSVSPPTGYILLPKSVAEKTTPEERLSAATTGKMISGGIDMASLLTIGASERSLHLAANTQNSVQVKISLPDNLPDELVGTGFHIPILLNAVDAAGNQIVVENNGIDVEVIQ